MAEHPDLGRQRRRVHIGALLLGAVGVLGFLGTHFGITTVAELQPWGYFIGAACGLWTLGPRLSHISSIEALGVKVELEKKLDEAVSRVQQVEEENARLTTTVAAIQANMTQNQEVHMHTGLSAHEIAEIVRAIAQPGQHSLGGLQTPVGIEKTQESSFITPTTPSPREEWKSDYFKQLKS